MIAEGVERSDQLLQLRSLGSELGQGYFFGRPLSGDVDEGMPPLLHEHRRWRQTVGRWILVKGQGARDKGKGKTFFPSSLSLVPCPLSLVPLPLTRITHQLPLRPEPQSHRPHAGLLDCPAPPPIALMRPALTLVGVTFKFGFAHCGWLKMFVDVTSIRSVGPRRAIGQPESLVQTEMPQVQPGAFDGATRRRAEPPDWWGANALTSYQPAIVGSLEAGSRN